MRTDSQRKAAYEARMLSTLLDPTGAAVVAKSVTNYNTYIDEFYPMQVTLREILSEGTIENFEFAAYEAFNGEMYHLSKVVTGNSRILAATKLVAKWSSAAYLGAASKVVLQDITSRIYDCIVP